MTSLYLSLFAEVVEECGSCIECGLPLPDLAALPLELGLPPVERLQRCLGTCHRSRRPSMFTRAKRR